MLASTDAFQCFPFYTYAEDGSARRENITDWALGQFQATYGPDVTKWDIFHYVYGLLHHPQYRARYAENLKRELPRIPLLPERAHFAACVHAGRELMNLHLGYEQVAEYPLQWIESRDAPITWRVEKMKLSPDKTSLRVNDWLTLAGIPADCFAYRLGNRSALDWIIDQYQVSADKRSGITSDPNRADAPEYIVRLVGRVVTVSVETARLARSLEGAVDLLATLGVAEGIPAINGRGTIIPLPAIYGRGTTTGHKWPMGACAIDSWRRDVLQVAFLCPSRARLRRYRPRRCVILFVGNRRREKRPSGRVDCAPAIYGRDGGNALCPGHLWPGWWRGDSHEATSDPAGCSSALPRQLPYDAQSARL
jgi:hypothetical protein